MDAEKRFSAGAEQRVMEQQHGLMPPSRRRSLQYSLGSDSTLLSSIHETEGPPREINSSSSAADNNSKTRWKSLPGSFQFHPRISFYNQGQHQNNHSGRSMASSITFSEVDSSINDDDASTEFHEPIDPFLEVNHHLDSQPCIPQRGQSTIVTSGSRSNSNSPVRDRNGGTNNHHHYSFNQYAVDFQPGMPQRRQSATSALSMASSDLEALILSTTMGINRVDLENHDLGDADAAPTRPTRLQSVVDAASSHADGDVGAIHELVPIHNTTNHNMPTTKELTAPDGLPQVKELADESMRSSGISSSASTATEPVPDYLQQDYITELIRAQLAELSASAAAFRTIVNIQDRKYGIRQYKKCFVGSEAVDAMLQAGLASTRTEAVELGRSWMTYLGLFQHVCASHIFKDKYLFYRFNNPDTNTVTGATDLCWQDGSTCQSSSVLGGQSSSCESNESSSGGDGSAKKEEKHKKSLILNSLRRQSRRKSQHSAPWYSMRQRLTIMEEVIDE